jgi:hypothetical protein
MARRTSTTATIGRSADHARYVYFVLFSLAAFELQQFLSWLNRTGRAGGNIERLLSTYDLLVILPFYAIAVRHACGAAHGRGAWLAFDLPANLAVIAYALLSLHHAPAASASSLSLLVIGAAIAAAVNIARHYLAAGR